MDRGKLAKAHCIVKHIDAALSLCETDEVFGLSEYREMQALIDALVRARQCVANIALRLGDETFYSNSPRIRVEIDYDKA